MCAALIEAGLIYYSGRLIDLVSQSEGDTLMGRHGLELLLVACFILFLRPLVFLTNMTMLNQVIAGSLRDRVRWAAHKHLVGQSRRFFGDDFAGRLANRVMQVGPAVEDNTFTTFEALWYCISYFATAVFIMSQMSPWLALPMLVWVVVYGRYAITVGKRVSVAAEAMSQTRSMVTARIVDAYTNIETVKLFAGDDRERFFAQKAIAKDRIRFLRFLRIMSRMTLGLATLRRSGRWCGVACALSLDARHGVGG